MKYSSFKPILQSHLWEYSSGTGVNATCDDDALVKAAPAGTYTQISSPGNVIEQAVNSEAGMMAVRGVWGSHCLRPPPLPAQRNNRMAGGATA